jgi:hypothetical protein
VTTTVLLPWRALVGLAPLRGPAYGHPHTSTSDGLAGTFLRSLVRAFAWQTASGVFHLFGGFAVAAVVLWRRRTRRTGGEYR